MSKGQWSYYPMPLHAPPPLIDQHEADAQFYRATLHALIEHGTAKARDIAT